MSTSAGTTGDDARASGTPEYALPRSLEEYERLSRQAAFMGGITEQLFRAAGLAPGIRVLDVGSGAGDVAFLAADLVGPEGEVVGIDVDAGALELARARAQASGQRNVTFVESDAQTLGGLGDLPGDFDAVVGRFVLMYSGDPAEELRRLVARVRPGGVVAFQELDLNPAVTSRSLPEGTLWDRIGGLVVETFRRAGMQVRMGPQLFNTYLAAGLPAPTMHDEALLGGGPNFGGYPWLAGVTRALAPLMARLGIADVEDLGLNTLADRLRDDTVGARAVVWTPSIVGAYARTPTRDPGLAPG